MEGTSTILKFVLIGWCAAVTRADLTEEEAETVLASLKLLNAGRCFLAFETDGGTGRDAVRKLGENRISTGVTKVELLGEHLEKWQPPDATTAIVVKVKSTRTVERALVEGRERLRRFVWFLIAEDDLDPEIGIPFDCQFFQIRRTASGSRRLVESYGVKNGSASRTEFGVWTPGRGLKACPRSLYARRTDLGGAEMRITVCQNYAVEESVRRFWKDSAKILNYSLSFEPGPKTEPGRSHATRDDRVDAREPDGTACISAITELDFEKDWIFASSGERVRLVTKFRGTNEIGWRAYVQPFAKELWAALGFWLLLSTVAIVVVDGPTKETVYADAFAGFFCLCNSDPMAVRPPRGPVPLSTRLVYLTSAAVPAVVIPAYSAYVLSSLSVTLPFEPFRDIEGFAKDGTFRLVAVDHTFTMRYFKGSKDPNLVYVHDHLFLGAERQASDFPSLFELLCADNKLVGLFVDARFFRRFFKCRMYVAPENVLTISTGFLLPKGSPLRAMLNARFIHYNEIGLKIRETNAESFRKVSFDEEGAALDSLDMSRTQAVFLLVPVGLVLSAIVLAVEMGIEQYSGRQLPARATKNSGPLRKTEARSTRLGAHRRADGAEECARCVRVTLARGYKCSKFY